MPPLIDSLHHAVHAAVSFNASVADFLELAFKGPWSGWYIALVLPWLTGVVQSPRSPKWIRVIVMLGMCVVAVVIQEARLASMGILTSDERQSLPIETLIGTGFAYKVMYKYLGMSRWERFTSDLASAPLRGVQQARAWLNALPAAMVMVRQQTSQASQTSLPNSQTGPESTGPQTNDPKG